MRKLSTVFLGLVFTSACFADTWYVDGNGEGDFLRIQAAVNAASDGDEIIVMPGTYTRNSSPVVDISEKSLWIHSSDGYSVTTIDGEGDNRCMTLVHSSSTIEGFTFQNGADDVVGGMAIYAGDVAITDCFFFDNHHTGGWNGQVDVAGALSTSGLANVAISDTDFIMNTSSLTGAISIGGNSSITNCLISENTGGMYSGGISMFSGDVSIDQCTIQYNDGGPLGGSGIWAYAGGIIILVDWNWIYVDTCNVKMTDCNVSQNTRQGEEDKEILITDGAGVQMYGENVVDNIYAENSGSVVSFQAGSVCTMIGPYSPTDQTATTLDIDAFNAEALLKITGTLSKRGCLTITNESNSLALSHSGQKITIMEFGQAEGQGQNVVFPVMPEGLGLKFVAGPINGGTATRVKLKVVEVEQPEFSDPISTVLSGTAADIISFDADGDGADEMAILYEGTPGAVAIYEMSGDGSPPAEIAGFAAFVGNNPVDVDKGDLNGDGLEDLIVANADDASITILLTSESDGTLSFSTSTINYGGTIQSLSCAAIIDWDGDINLDAVVGVDFVSEKLSAQYIVMLDIATSPTSGPSFDIPMYQTEYAGSFADAPTCVDDTGGLGFVGGTHFGCIHRAIQGDSLQTIAELSGDNIVTIEAIDLDVDGGDGYFDLMVGSDQAETIYLFQGGDEFGSPIPLIVSEEVKDVMAIDADSDGDMDLVMTAPNSTNPLILLRNDNVNSELMPVGLGGITWSKQNVETFNPPRHVTGGGLDGKEEDDDWLGGTNSNSTLNGGIESQLEQINFFSSQSCAADFNNDNEVDVNDLLIFIGEWGKCDSCQEDLNNDGNVGVDDLLLFLGAWGTC